MTDPVEVAPSRLSAASLISECVAALVARPSRSVLTALGVTLGVGTFVAVIGLAGTASGQISDRFDVLTATHVTVDDSRTSPGDRFPFPDDADARMSDLNGVEAAGVLWFVNEPDVEVATAIGADVTAGVQLYAASGGLWDVAEPTLVSGRLYDEAADRHSLRVVVIGQSVADRLGISTLATRPRILVDEVPFDVVAIISQTRQFPELALSVTFPRGTAQDIWGLPNSANPARAEVRTALGAAQQVAGELPYALAPYDVDDVSVIPPPDPRTLRESVDSDLQTLFLVLAVICLLIGAIGIANTTLVAVIERTPEIGLRRALGATPGHIARQITCESALLGGIGGLVGTCIGVAITIAVALLRDWTAILDPRYSLAAPLLGLLVGALAGLYPARRAARIEPTEALRR